MKKKFSKATKIFFIKRKIGYKKNGVGNNLETSCFNCIAFKGDGCFDVPCDRFKIKVDAYSICKHFVPRNYKGKPTTHFPAHKYFLGILNDIKKMADQFYEGDNNVRKDN